MSRRPTGNAVRYGDKWYARLTTGNNVRRAVQLVTCHVDDEAGAHARTALMADVVATLRSAKRDDFVPIALEKLATLPKSRLGAFVTLARGVANGTESLLPTPVRDEARDDPDAASAVRREAAEWRALYLRLVQTFLSINRADAVAPGVVMTTTLFDESLSDVELALLAETSVSSVRRSLEKGLTAEDILRLSSGDRLLV